MHDTNSPGGDRPPFPLAADAWQRVCKRLSLSPQQVRIVELLLSGEKCKDIGPALGLATPTVRTYLKRIYERHGIHSQSELLLLIMAVAQEPAEKWEAPPLRGKVR